MPCRSAPCPAIDVCAYPQVFGRALLCRSLEVAAGYSKQADLGLTCITLEGDMVRVN